MVTFSMAKLGRVPTTTRFTLAVKPSRLATMSVDPVPVAVTRPVELTEATAGTEELKENTFPAIAFPCASRAVAVACVCSLTPTVDAPNDTTTDATAAGRTTIVPDPVTPSIVASTVVEPTATAVTAPVEEIVATPAFAMCHMTVRPEIVAPLDDFAVAVTVPVS